MDLQTALELVDDDLPDGAWMACLCEMTGMDEGEVAAELYAAEQRQQRHSAKRRRNRANRRARRAT